MSFHAIKATDSFEVEVDLAGTFLPGSPETGPSYACGGTPAEPDMMEDVEAMSLNGLRLVRPQPRDRASHDLVWERFDLLKGLDKVARETILANVIEFLGDGAQETLMQALPDDDQ